MKRTAFIVSVVLLLLIHSQTTKDTVLNTNRNIPLRASRSLLEPRTTTTTIFWPTTTSSSTTTEPPTTTTVKVTTTQKPVVITTTTEPERVEASSVEWGNCPDAILLHKYESDSCWSGLVDDYDWPVSLMLKILYCESQGKRSAHNSSGANGLMQDLNGPYDPKENMDEAYAKYSAASPHTQPWISSKNCWG